METKLEVIKEKSKKVCFTCNGKKSIEDIVYVPMPFGLICPIYNNKQCLRCKGKGYIEK
ncbi:ankyrin [Candidatus Pacearchaeota archaeon]|jgi:hypothetical protein|nr:ankyrin [Candidatus Pacearchaeota archaeon]